MRDFKRDVRSRFSEMGKEGRYVAKDFERTVKKASRKGKVIIALITLVFLIALFLSVKSCFSAPLNAATYAGNYQLMLVDFTPSPSETYFYKLQLDDSGLYIITQEIIIGATTYEYPAFTGVWYIDPTRKTIVLDINGTKAELKEISKGVLAGNVSLWGDYALVGVDYENLCPSSPTCQFSIEGKSEVLVGEEAVYFVTTSNSLCRFNVTVDGGSVLDIKYTKTGDAIVTVQFDEEGAGVIKVGNTEFNVNVVNSATNGG